jgi:hypothetical protein
MGSRRPTVIASLKGWYESMLLSYITPILRNGAESIFIVVSPPVHVEQAARIRLLAQIERAPQLSAAFPRSQPIESAGARLCKFGKQPAVHAPVGIR